jgi:hypothetical protein
MFRGSDSEACGRITEFSGDDHNLPAGSASLTQERATRIVRLDSDGAKQWEQTYGSSNYDYIAGLEPTSDGGFVFGGSIGIGSRVIKLRPELPCDRDGDGVPDIRDFCPDTPSGQIVDADGCSLDQLVPCAGPWKNHGDYLAAMKNATEQFVQDGLLTREQQHMLLRQAARSDCGGK